MVSRGFWWTCVAHSTVEWYDENEPPEDGSGSGTINLAAPNVHLPSLRKSRLARIIDHSLPLPSSPFSGAIHCNQPSPPVQSTSSTTEASEHHIIMFFRPSALQTCSRCYSSFIPLINNSPLFPPSQLLCAYHSGYYVCRRHPGETKLSINGQGDGLGYYGNGEEGIRKEVWVCEGGR
jgi:hypothetical protein